MGQSESEGGVKLRFLDVQEVLLGRGGAAVPGAGAVAPLDAGKVFGLVPDDVVVHHPVRPQAFRLRVDGAGDGVTAVDLHTDMLVTKKESFPKVGPSLKQYEKETSYPHII